MADAPTAVQDAVALLTVAMNAAGEELDDLVHEYLDKLPARDLVYGLVALSRSLCFTTARMVHAIDDQLTDSDTVDLTDAQVRPAAIEVLRAYARAAAREPDPGRPWSDPDATA